jgi:hypothetical protein
MIGIVLGIAVCVSVSPARAAGLEKFTWDNRLLLVFAPTVEDPLLQSQQRLLAPRKDGVDERHMRIIEIAASNTVTVNGQRDSDLDASRLRRSYAVPTDAFAVILVGKDGGEKGRWTEPVSLDDVFDMIDAMPMRQEEMLMGG